MTGPEHYREAEQLLKTGTDMTGRAEHILAVLAAAQVHARLAQVALDAEVALNSAVVQPAWDRAIS